MTTSERFALGPASGWKGPSHKVTATWVAGHEANRPRFITSARQKVGPSPPAAPPKSSQRQKKVAAAKKSRAVELGLRRIINYD